MTRKNGLKNIEKTASGYKSILEQGGRAFTKSKPNPKGLGNIMSKSKPISTDGIGTGLKVGLGALGAGGLYAAAS